MSSEDTKTHSNICSSNNILQIRFISRICLYRNFINLDRWKWSAYVIWKQQKILKKYVAETRRNMKKNTNDGPICGWHEEEILSKQKKSIYLYSTRTNKNI